MKVPNHLPWSRRGHLLSSQVLSGWSVGHRERSVRHSTRRLDTVRGVFYTVSEVLDTVRGVLGTVRGVLDIGRGGLDTVSEVLDTGRGVFDTVRGALDTVRGVLDTGRERTPHTSIPLYPCPTHSCRVRHTCTTSVGDSGTRKREFKLPWREAASLFHHDDIVDSYH